VLLGLNGSPTVTDSHKTKPTTNPVSVVPDHENLQVNIERLKPK